MTVLYLDSAATTPVRREVLEAMWPYLTQEFGNASSHHDAGRRALAGLDRARATVAQVLNCRPAEVVFTSGGTEADNLAVKGIALGRRDRREEPHVLAARRHRRAARPAVDAGGQHRGDEAAVETRVPAAHRRRACGVLGVPGDGGHAPILRHHHPRV